MLPLPFLPWFEGALHAVCDLDRLICYVAVKLFPVNSEDRMFDLYVVRHVDGFSRLNVDSPVRFYRRLFVVNYDDIIEELSLEDFSPGEFDVRPFRREIYCVSVVSVYVNYRLVDLRSILSSVVAPLLAEDLPHNLTVSHRASMEVIQDEPDAGAWRLRERKTGLALDGSPIEGSVRGRCPRGVVNGYDDSAYNKERAEESQSEDQTFFAGEDNRHEVFLFGGFSDAK